MSNSDDIIAFDAALAAFGASDSEIRRHFDGGNCNESQPECVFDFDSEEAA